MPNEPKPAAQKRAPMVTPRQNAQDDHEGSPHRPEEFLAADPAAPEAVKGAASEQFYGSRAWEATTPTEQRAEADPMAAPATDQTREQRRVAPPVVARHAAAQDSDTPAIPGGRHPDRAMCEDRNRPGYIDKADDC